MKATIILLLVIISILIVQKQKENDFCKTYTIEVYRKNDAGKYEPIVILYQAHMGENELPSSSGYKVVLKPTQGGDERE